MTAALTASALPRSVRLAGRGRLPVCVVKIRSVLVLMVCVLRLVRLVLAKGMNTD